MVTSKGMDAMDTEVVYQYVTEEALFEKRMAALSGVTVEQLQEQRDTVPNLSQYLDVMFQGWLLAKGIDLIDETNKGLLV